MTNELELASIIEVHPAQLTVWDELLDQQVQMPREMRRFVEGFLSHVALLDDAHLIRVGRVCAREAARKRTRREELKFDYWAILRGAAADEWLRRHPRKLRSE